MSPFGSVCSICGCREMVDQRGHGDLDLEALFGSGIRAASGYRNLLVPYSWAAVEAVNRCTGGVGVPWGIVPPFNSDGSEWDWEGSDTQIDRFNAWASPANSPLVRQTISSIDGEFVLIDFRGSIDPVSAILNELLDFRFEALSRLRDYASQLNYLMLMGGPDRNFAIFLFGDRGAPHLDECVSSLRSLGIGTLGRV